MANKRNKDRKKLNIELSEGHRAKVNEYLAKQNNLTNTVETALLLAQKIFGDRDLVVAYQDFSLKTLRINLLEDSLLQSSDSQKDSTPNSQPAKENKKVEVKQESKPVPKPSKKANKKKPTNPPKKDTKNIKPKQAKEVEKLADEESSDLLDSNAINKMFFSGNPSDL